ncbi:ABC transporter ATP-binding protein [Lentzea flaviverrucosa]|uniref:Putative ABC transport system ATP-binding protein n=1 Tax=Lentzea flaviverrucosa TaxID=200379 RepID=A0A1H9XWP2_9PSEU|nr:ATP-binding cassette domain-containing protein [Lentzea flaviverrucosa]RDI34268.1 putative ABC transport system ATP-binding protein [Lentzea flaviverrucosa]SES50561.1 putative ABC transport system ATP-binding protein [Lentzea flaviverrucosa]
MSLTLTGVTLTYPDGGSRLTALDQVTLDVPRGSLTAVVGPSGSGKSSLLAVAATLVSPDAGTVTVDGTTTTGMTRGELTDLRRRKIGIVFQHPSLLPALSAREQLQVMAWIDGRSPARARARAMELLDAVGLAPEAERRPHQLSGGQRQRVNIARALMNDPTVLLVDEPTSALDHERGAAVVGLLTRLTRLQGTATVLVTHDRGHLTGADQIAEVHDGRLRSGTRRELRQACT